MSFFIKCVSPSHLQGALYVLRDGKPFRLNDPRSSDRDWFMTSRAAATAKRRAERMFSLYSKLKFRIERT